jgi:transcriptional regulator with XRE-family HTH domain
VAVSQPTRSALPPLPITRARFLAIPERGESAARLPSRHPSGVLHHPVVNMESGPAYLRAHEQAFEASSRIPTSSSFCRAGPEATARYDRLGRLPLGQDRGLAGARRGRHHRERVRIDRLAQTLEQHRSSRLSGREGRTCRREQRRCCFHRVARAQPGAVGGCTAERASKANHTDLAQSELAKRMGTSQGQVTRFESAQSSACPPSPATRRPSA